MKKRGEGGRGQAQKNCCILQFPRYINPVRIFFAKWVVGVALCARCVLRAITLCVALRCVMRCVMRKYAVVLVCGLGALRA